MIACENCGAGLVFEPASQRLVCGQCGSSFLPDKVKDGTKADFDGSFAVTAYRCSQCGGEICSTDMSFTGFCMYCGAHAVMEERMTAYENPAYILPFKIDKKCCKEAFIKNVKKDIFLPKAFKDPQYLEQFRGIYMPYWLYDFKIEGRVGFKGERVVTLPGDEQMLQTFNCFCTVHASYEGLAFDASSSFEDHIAEAIAPFEAQSLRKFSPAYLCGFYADYGDVDSRVYIDDAAELVSTSLGERLAKVKAFNGMSFGSKISEAVDRQLLANTDTVQIEPKAALMPVWFLSYKNHKRISYLVVNGASGKVYGERPVSYPKVALFTLLLALPLFFLYQSLLLVTPNALVELAAVFGTAVATLAAINADKIFDQENRLKDQGYLYKLNKEIEEREAFISGEEEVLDLSQKGVKVPRKHKVEKQVGATSLGTVFAVILQVFLQSYDMAVAIIQLLVFVSRVIAWIGLTGLTGFCLFLIGRTVIRDSLRARGMFAAILAILSAIICHVIFWVNPVSDYWFYAGTVLCLAATVFCLCSMIGQINQLATRPLPQLDRKGGNVYA